MILLLLFKVPRWRFLERKEAWVEAGISRRQGSEVGIGGRVGPLGSELWVGSSKVVVWGGKRDPAPASDTRILLSHHFLEVGHGR